VPRPHPPEFHGRAVELARERAKPIALIAEDFWISENCLRNWLHQADLDEGRREGLTTDERRRRSSPALRPPRGYPHNDARVRRDEVAVP
jgi:transposase-like protein